jgi:hypothetical protein
MNYIINHWTDVFVSTLYDVYTWDNFNLSITSSIDIKFI